MRFHTAMMVALAVGGSIPSAKHGYIHHGSTGPKNRPKKFSKKEAGGRRVMCVIQKTRTQHKVKKNFTTRGRA